MRPYPLFVLFVIVSVLHSSSGFVSKLYNEITGLLNIFEPETSVDVLVNNTIKDGNVISDTYLRAPELIAKYGYPVETHNVTTVDGYVLEMHRIPREGAQAVLLMHGILDTSATWILMGPKSGLAYLLYNRGYDVWMGNVRGNTYSRKHINVDAEDKRFWDFSFHEMGVYDLPKMIDFILERIHQDKIHYIGHSQGTTIFWVMCSENPEYSEKILSMQALAPVAFLDNIPNPFLKAMSFGMDIINVATNMFNINELLSSSQPFVVNAQTACNAKALTQEMCSNALFLIAGFNSEQLNKTMLPVILSHTPSGASAKQFIHFGQLIRSGLFTKFNYGLWKNYVRYKTFTPSSYKLLNVRCPVSLYYSKNDWLVSTKSVNQLQLKLPNVVDKYVVEDRKFNHLDFVWAIDVETLLYRRVFANLKKMENENETF